MRDAGFHKDRESVLPKAGWKKEVPLEMLALGGQLLQLAQDEGDVPIHLCVLLTVLLEGLLCVRQLNVHLLSAHPAIAPLRNSANITQSAGESPAV